MCAGCVHAAVYSKSQEHIFFFIELVVHEHLVSQKTVWVTHTHEAPEILATQALLTSLQPFTFVVLEC